MLQANVPYIVESWICFSQKSTPDVWNSRFFKSNSVSLGGLKNQYSTVVLKNNQPDLHGSHILSTPLGMDFFLIVFHFFCVCVMQVQKKGKEVQKAQKQLQMDLAAIEEVCIW